MRDNEYAIMAEVEDSHWWYKGLRALIRDGLNQFELDSESLILDVGCGTGANLELVREQGQGVGVDMHPMALSHCRKRGHTRLSRGDVLHLPIPDDSADVVLLMDVLYHQAVPDKVAALVEVRRLLKPGGRVLINVPAYQWMRSSHDAAIHTDQRFTKAELWSLAEEAGLCVESSRYWNTLLFPAVFVVRMLRRNRSEGGSDLSGYQSSALSYMFEQILALERLLFSRIPAPFGLSIFLVARK